MSFYLLVSLDPCGCVAIEGESSYILLWELDKENERDLHCIDYYFKCKRF